MVNIESWNLVASIVKLFGPLVLVHPSTDILETSFDSSPSTQDQFCNTPTLQPTLWLHLNCDHFPSMANALSLQLLQAEGSNIIGAKWSEICVKQKSQDSLNEFGTWLWKRRNGNQWLLLFMWCNKLWRFSCNFFLMEQGDVENVLVWLECQ